MLLLITEPEPFLSLPGSLISLCQPLEFCSDVFLLPLGSPPKDTLDLTDSEDESSEPLAPPAPPPLDPALFEILMQSLDNNNRPPPSKHKARTFIEYSDNVEHFI